MLTKKNILNKIDCLKGKYENEGIVLYTIFGSYAKDTQDKYSDKIDISYTINYKKFSKRYKDGFSKLLRLEDIKKELEKEFGLKVDLVPYKKEFKEQTYV